MLARAGRAAEHFFASFLDEMAAPDGRILWSCRKLLAGSPRLRRAEPGGYRLGQGAG
jgi:hypothetical protein